jgi:hypothetical protein
MRLSVNEMSAEVLTGRSLSEEVKNICNLKNPVNLKYEKCCTFLLPS